MKLQHPLPPREFLEECFVYDPEKGGLTWKIRPEGHFQTPRRCRSWNARFAGTTAGWFSHGYIWIVVESRKFLAHRLIWKLMTGQDPVMEIDHIDRKRNNNKWSNLREATPLENLRNTSIRSDNASGYKGVCFHSQTGTWRATITIAGKQQHLGCYDSPEAAHRAYCEASCDAFGVFATTGAP